ncbi:MAG: BREX system P-loop protein BrxC, partial [Caldisericia bacterium]|nr:BREX system P-loop protein BrxC [Caldisericia bacterium]
MKIQEMFVKPIDRSIEGVIKADANEHLLQEVEEYVLTEEISLKVFDFLDEYNDPQSGNGSWISGFFGSGKSHLLKMLSLLLENHVIEGKETVEYFKPKCNDTLLKGLMDKAAKIPSKSILFNIDQKANITHKKQTDAVLSVFVKVFNEMQGFYGGIDYVAKLESDLHNRGQLDTFKEAIQKITNRPWNEVREESLLEEDSIDQAYAITAGKELKSINGILEKYKDSYKMSIEDFANNVKEYIDKQGKQFRLNFFVDEVGQFIADNVKLMTNLQTIAESLNTKCKGRSWILVTAQDEMDMIVGEISKQQGNDFTKIQARFHNRIKLTSKNVAEVIQKRLLDKTPNAKHNLKNLYQRERENLDTLFRFTDNSRNYESFADEEHFISCYPFIPYQFQMFQSSIEKLSAHNAFEGKYSSVGERSMLGVFQKVGIHLQNYDEGSLATFDTMFEGIRSTLKSSTQRDVITAENNLSHNQFAIKVLKALFLVKYNKEFKPTISNIIVLLIPKFCADLQKLRIQTQEALDLLVQQTYIQRTGDFYEYLTDKEKDIEKEIKNMDITQEERYRLIQELIFNYIPSGKITHKAYHQDFSYTLKIDNSIISRSKEEVSINFVTPLCEDYENKTMFLMPGNAAKEMLLYLPLYKHWVEDVTQYLRTRKFVQSFTQKEETLQHIISKQAEANQKRHKDIQQTFDEMIQEAEIYSRGHESSSPKKNAKDRIIEGFQKLIDSIYRNRDWIGDAQYKEDSILKALNDDALIVSLSQPVKEVLNYINIQDKLATRLTVKQVKDHFSKPPYGWEQYVVLTFLAKLWSSHKIEFSKDHIVQEN